MGGGGMSVDRQTEISDAIINKTDKSKTSCF
jgi:hypothetical protein